MLLGLNAVVDEVRGLGRGSASGPWCRAVQDRSCAAPSGPAEASVAVSGVRRWGGSAGSQRGHPAGVWTWSR